MLRLDLITDISDPPSGGEMLWRYLVANSSDWLLSQYSPDAMRFHRHSKSNIFGQSQTRAELRRFHSQVWERQPYTSGGDYQYEQ